MRLLLPCRSGTGRAAGGDAMIESFIMSMRAIVSSAELLPPRPASPS